MYCYNRIPIVELIGIFFLESSPSPGNLSASSSVDIYKFVNTIAAIITEMPVMTIAIRIGRFSINNFFLHFSFFELLSLVHDLSERKKKSINNARDRPKRDCLYSVLCGRSTDQTL